MDAHSRPPWRFSSILWARRHVLPSECSGVLHATMVARLGICYRLRYARAKNIQVNTKYRTPRDPLFYKSHSTTVLKWGNITNNTVKWWPNCLSTCQCVDLFRNFLLLKRVKWPILPPCCENSGQCHRLLLHKLFENLHVLMRWPSSLVSKSLSTSSCMKLGPIL